MYDRSFRKHWLDLGKFIAMGNTLFYGELYAIYDNVDISNIKPEFLPNENMVKGTPKERKNFAFKLAENIWGLTPEDWLKMENDWLMDARKLSGSQETSGKDQISDVVSVEILLGIIAAAKIVHEHCDGSNLSTEAFIAVNAILTEACAKGRTRMQKTEGGTVYGALKHNGLMIGLGGGKYLPNPEITLPVLFLMLNKDRMVPAIYED